MFESVNGRTDAHTHALTPARPVYYKLTKEPSGELIIVVSLLSGKWAMMGNNYGFTTNYMCTEGRLQ